jgi:uncharacterized repeat protein (TIGR01451 family)
VTPQVVEGTETDVAIDMPSTAEGFAGQNTWLGSIEVRNLGPATATGLTVTLEFPPGLSPSYPLMVQCTETNTGLSCSYPWGSLPPGAASLGIIGVTAAEAGTYTVRGSVTADQTDPVTENNTDATVVTANPAADLSAQITDSADPASPGTVLTYTVTLTNHGPSPASSVALTDTWSTTVRGGAQLLSFTASQGQCVLVADQRIDCQLGGLASGANAALTVSLRPKGTGSVTDQTQVRHRVRHRHRQQHQQRDDNGRPGWITGGGTGAAAAPWWDAGVQLRGIDVVEDAAARGRCRGESRSGERPPVPQVAVILALSGRQL